MLSRKNQIALEIVQIYEVNLAIQKIKRDAILGKYNEHKGSFYVLNSDWFKNLKVLAVSYSPHLLSVFQRFSLR